MKKTALLILLFIVSLSSKAQLGGPGFAPFVGISGEGKRFSGKQTGDQTQYGFLAYLEGRGFIFNQQFGVGYLHNTYQFPDTAGNNITINRDYLQIIPSFKYWIGNSMRAGSITGMKCAHKTKILYNYTVKPYLIFGFPYNLLLNKSDVEATTDRAFRKSGFSIFAGIGSNLVELGGNIDPKMIFIEFRLIQEMKPFLKDETFASRYGFGFQAVLGFKFEKD
jgi:hypothetical protein